MMSSKPPALSTLPEQSPSTIGIYNEVPPDASKAQLPPKPPIPLTGSGRTSYLVPQVTVPPSPAKHPCYQKRTYSSHNYGAVVASSQYHRAQDSINNAPKYKNRYDGFVERGTAERAGTASRTTSNNNIADNRNNSNDGNTYDYRQPSTSTFAPQNPPSMTKLERARLNIQSIHDSVLGGAETLAPSVQDYLTCQLHENLACIPAMMVWLIAKRVTNKTHNLSYGIIHWAQLNADLELMEYMLKDRLYAFDVEAAFRQGLMGISEVMDLMDGQELLQSVRKKLKERKERQVLQEHQEREEEARKKATEQPRANPTPHADHCESDTGSADMDLSE